jgi:hypothetical protein
MSDTVKTLSQVHFTPEMGWLRPRMHIQHLLLATVFDPNRNDFALSLGKGKTVQEEGGGEHSWRFRALGSNGLNPEQWKGSSQLLSICSVSVIQ